MSGTAQLSLRSAPVHVRAWRWVAAVVLVAAIHVCVALLAARGNSSTFDEPVHTLAAWMAVHGDLSVNPEHPPLWKYLAGLTIYSVPLKPEHSAAYSEVRTDPVAQWHLAVDTLYRQGLTSPDGEEVVWRARVAMSLLGGALIVAAGLFARRLAGGGSEGAREAVFTAVLLALDPMLLAHTPIVSNDVAVSLALLGCVWIAWELRRESLSDRAGVMLSVGLGLVLAVAATTKFSGLAALPLAAGIALIRRRPRVWALLVALPIAYVGLWAVYGFRYAPASGNPALIDSQAIAQRVDVLKGGGGHDLPTRALLAVEGYRVLPQAYTSGLLMSYGVTRGNPALAAGFYSDRGLFWYFPFAIAVKTPVGLLALWALLCWRRPRPESTEANAVRWTVILLAGLLVMSPLNIGVRHAMPLTTMLTVLTGAALATRWNAADRHLRTGAVVAFTLIGVEVAFSFPRYLSFFNLPSVAIAGGREKLLADSNLDWGQDLARLAHWRREHPEGTLYLAYWGTVDPAAYRLSVTHLPGTYDLARQQAPADPANPGYVAVSVTYLQGLTRGGVPAPFFLRLSREAELARIGDSIRVYRWPAVR